MTSPSPPTVAPYSGNGVLQSSNNHNWETPQWLFDKLNSVFRFTLDAAATPETAKTPGYYTPQADALTMPWIGRVWLNPPYGRAIGLWMEKARHEAIEGAAELVVCLIPARTDTAWWHDHVRHGSVWFLRGRLKFGSAANSAPFPSAIVLFRRYAIPATRYWTPTEEELPL